MEAILAQLIGGAVGGLVGGKALKDSDLGNIGNLITAAIGGVGGGHAKRHRRTPYPLAPTDTGNSRMPR